MKTRENKSNKATFKNLINAQQSKLRSRSRSRSISTTKKQSKIKNNLPKQLINQNVQQNRKQDYKAKKKDNTLMKQVIGLKNRVTSIERLNEQKNKQDPKSNQQQYETEKNQGLLNFLEQFEIEVKKQILQISASYEKTLVSNKSYQSQQKLSTIDFHWKPTTNMMPTLNNTLNQLEKNL